VAIAGGFEINAFRRDVVMDKQKLIEKLNEDLSMEFRSILQYVQHVATMKGARYQNMIEELENHIHQEVTHAKTLARQIDFLGGVPSSTAAEFDTVSDTREAIQQDLELEERQLERYRQRVAEAEQLDLPDVAEALAPLLQQTQEHVRDLRVALDV
jgi:bacterioferritin